MTIRRGTCTLYPFIYRESLALSRAIDIAKMHIKLYSSSVFTIFNITLTFVYN